MSVGIAHYRGSCAKDLLVSGDCGTISNEHFSLFFHRTLLHSSCLYCFEKWTTRIC